MLKVEQLSDLIIDKKSSIKCTSYKQKVSVVYNRYY